MLCGLGLAGKAEELGAVEEWRHTLLVVERLLNWSRYRYLRPELGLALAGARSLMELAEHGLQLLPANAHLGRWRTLYRAGLAVGTPSQEAVQMLGIEVHSLAARLLHRVRPGPRRERRAAWQPHDVLVPVGHFPSELLEESEP